MTSKRLRATYYCGGVAPREHNRWIDYYTNIIVIYVVALCGSEGLLLDLDELLSHWNKGNQSYIVIALQGQIKGEHHERYHLVPSVLVTQLGVNGTTLLEGPINYRQTKGFVDGPAI
jgi:hypothetical protein